MYTMGYVFFHSHQMGALDTVLAVNAHFSPSSHRLFKFTFTFF
jgi:hypothetical protein